MKKDYYKIMQLDRNASETEIKKKYRELVKLCHPDRQHNASEKDKEKNKLLFKEVREAYSVLSDPDKRAKFDKEPQSNSKKTHTSTSTKQKYNFNNFDKNGVNDIFNNFFTSQPKKDKNTSDKVKEDVDNVFKNYFNIK